MELSYSRIKWHIGLHSLDFLSFGWREILATIPLIPRVHDEYGHLHKTKPHRVSDGDFDARNFKIIHNRTKKIIKTVNTTKVSRLQSDCLF